MTLARVCVDASFVVRLLTVAPEQSPYRELWDQWTEANIPIIAPTLILYEVTNALYRSAIAGLFSVEVSQELQNVALDLQIVLYGDGDLHRRAWEMARQFSMSAAYDAHYLALADTMQAELWTADRRLVNLVGSILDWVHLVEAA